LFLGWKENSFTDCHCTPNFTRDTYIEENDALIILTLVAIFSSD